MQAVESNQGAFTRYLLIEVSMLTCDSYIRDNSFCTFTLVSNSVRLQKCHKELYQDLQQDMRQLKLQAAQYHWEILCPAENHSKKLRRLAEIMCKLCKQTWRRKARLPDGERSQEDL